MPGRRIIPILRKRIRPGRGGSIRLTLYGKPDCPLCDVALERVRRAGRAFPIEVECVNIEERLDAHARYRDRIPVVALDGEVVLEGKISELWLRRALQSRWGDGR